MAESRKTRGGLRRPIAFISHHSSQEATARHLKAVLARNGVDGWMAPDDIEPGVPFDRAIIDQLRRSDMIILLFCARSDQSKHVKRELMLAEDQNMLVYPVRLEAIEPTGLAYWLQDYQWTDWIDRRDATVEAMVATVKRQVAAADDAAFAGTEEAVTEPTPAPTDIPPPDPTSTPHAPARATTELPPAAPSPRRSGLGRNGWIAVAVIGALLVLLIGLGMFAMAPGPDSRERDRTASGDRDAGDDADQDGGRQTADVAFFRPGQWRTTSWINEIDAPAIPENMRSEMVQQLNANRQTSEQCVSPEEAGNPQAGFFNLDEQGSCTSGEPMIANGRIDISMSCTAPGMPQLTEIRMEGSYTPEDFSLNLTMTTDVGAAGGVITMRGVATGEHLGDC